MGKLRAIRLKEYDPSLTRHATPIEKYLRRSDGTLGTGPFDLRTDENGFILTGNNVNENNTPIVLTGGSFVESSFVPETSRFASHLERLMPEYRVLNGGYSGSTSLQLFNVMVNKIYPLVGEGGHLVFFIGHTDADILDRPGGYWNETRLWAPIVPVCPPGKNVSTGAESVHKITTMVLQTAKTLNLNLTLAVSPYRQAPFDEPFMKRIYKSNRQAYEAKRTQRESIRTAVLNAASDLNADVIDFQALGCGNPDWFYDELHLNTRGQSKFAQVLATELGKRL